MWLMYRQPEFSCDVAREEGLLEPRHFDIKIWIDKYLTDVPKDGLPESFLKKLDGIFSKYSTITKEMQQACSIIPELLCIELTYDLKKTFNCDGKDIRIEVMENIDDCKMGYRV